MSNGFKIIRTGESNETVISWEQAIYQDIEQFRKEGKPIVVGMVGNTEEELSKFRKVYDNLIQQILENTDGSDLQKALFLHNYLLANVEYPNIKLRKEEDNSKRPIIDRTNRIEENYSTPYGVLINKKALCSGIADTINLVLNDSRINVPSKKVSAYSISDHGKVGHAWNIVYIDGIPYQLDTTHDIIKNPSSIKIFNDPSKVFEDVENEIVGAKATRFSDKRFLVDDQQFMQDHIWQGDYPVCSKTYSRDEVSNAMEELKQAGIAFNYDQLIKNIFQEETNKQKKVNEVSKNLDDIDSERN